MNKFQHLSKTAPKIEPEDIEVHFDHPSVIKKPFIYSPQTGSSWEHVNRIIDHNIVRDYSA